MRPLGRYKDGKKITVALSDQEFIEGMERGPFLKPKHKALLALLHYSGLRRSEIIKPVKEDFYKTKEFLYFNVWVRLKGSKRTVAIPLSLKAPYVDLIVKAVDYTRKGQRVFPYSSMTVYNIVHRVFKYPHLHRLTQITWLIKEHGVLIARQWTGLSLRTLEYYCELVGLEKVGRSLEGRQ